MGGKDLRIKLNLELLLAEYPSIDGRQSDLLKEN
jgi:hypothetical protein